MAVAVMALVVIVLVLAAMLWVLLMMVVIESSVVGCGRVGGIGGSTVVLVLAVLWWSCQG